MNFVKGSYDTPQEAFDAVNSLEAEGYRAEDIRLVSNAAIRDTFMDRTDAKFTTKEDYGDVDRAETHEEDESIWEKIKDFFSSDDDYDRERTDPQDDPLVNYRKDIEAGKIVLVVEGERIRSEEATVYYEEDDILNQPIDDPVDPVDRPGDLGDHDPDF